ncbi:MAG: hypothetical protein HDQ91_05475 [Desulfovibrio sp.]|nr:hypothetical protein [Desulfovibrio sp.]
MQVGDWVKVTRQAESFEAGWDTTWIPEMNSLVGQTGEVVSVDKRIIVRFSKICFLFFYFVLEKAKKPEPVFKPFDKVLVRDKDDEIWRCNLFSHTNEGIYVCVIHAWEQCIPYEGNEHLVGTTGKPEADDS